MVRPARPGAPGRLHSCSEGLHSGTCGWYSVPKRRPGGGGGGGVGPRFPGCSNRLQRGEEDPLSGLKFHTYWDLKLTFLLILPMPYFKWYSVKVQVNICFITSQSFEGFLSRLLFSAVYCAKEKLFRFYGCVPMPWRRKL